MRRQHLSLYPGEQQQCHRRARGFDVEDRRGPAVLLRAARHRRRGSGVDDYQRILQDRVPTAPDGICGRGDQAARTQARRKRRMIQQNGKTLLEVRRLCATVNGIDILKGIDLTVRSGEVHALMGPNGSGKSTFAKALAGHPAYVVTGGTVFYEGKNLLELKPEERARAGVFLGFQYPIEIPGVANSQFLRLAYNTVQAQRGKDELDPLEFDDFVREKMKLLEMNPDFLDRSVNEGFSGGEKKRNEVLQMALLEPRLAILDETDSGLDIDALRVVSNGVNAHRRDDRSMLLITHYQRLLNYVVPDRVHVLSNGPIVRCGDRQLALELEEKGYTWLEQQADAPAPSGARA